MRRAHLMVLTAPALAAALALAGCGGSDTSSAPADSASAAPPTSSAPASSAATQPSADASDAPTTTTAEVKDPCDVLPASKVSSLTGVEVGAGKGGGVAGSSLCSWSGGKAGSASYVIFTAQEGTAVGGSLAQVSDQLKTQFGGDVSDVTVTGADEAIYLSGTKSGLVIDVIARKGDAFYQVLATTPTSNATKYKDGVLTMAEALVAG